MTKGCYETKTRCSYCGKQSGCYGGTTVTEKALAGGFQWKNGTIGTKCQQTQSSTVRFGDKNGYKKVHSEQSVRNVTYNKSSSNITFNDDSCGQYGDYDDGGPYGGYDNDDVSYDAYGSDSDDGVPFGGYGSHSDSYYYDSDY